MEKNSSLISSLDYFVSQKTKVVLMSLLFLLNVVIRVPSVPHEEGYDSFFIHGLANSITNFGVARWWDNWLSVFGLYPYSYASAVPFSLSGISQLTGISMEFTILLFCIFLGLFTIFASYLLASMFYNNFISRFLFSFLFSLTASTMSLTTWQLTTRAQFLVFFPFFIYQLYKALKNNKKFILLLIMTFIFVLATHHYAYFLIFFSALISIVFLVYKPFLKVPTDYRKYFNQNFLYLMIALALFIIPFMFAGSVGLIETGSRYAWIISILTISVRNLGPVFPLSVGAFIYLSLKRIKSSQEWSILICTLPTIVFSYNQIYGYLIVYLVFIILGAIGINNIMENYVKNKNFILIFISSFLILNVVFSGFFAHWKTGSQGGYSDWYMKEETYLTGQWIKDNFNPNMIGTYNGFEVGRAYASYGGIPAMYCTDGILNYITGSISYNESDLYKNSVFSKEFYFDSVYTLQKSIDPAGRLSWILDFPITDGRAKDFLNGLNISFFVEDRNVPCTFTNSLSDDKSRIYDGGRMRLWLI